MSLFIRILFVCVSGLPSVVVAQQVATYDYYGVSYNQATLIESGFSQEQEHKAVVLTAGRRDERGVSLELRVGVGLDPIAVEGVADTQISIDSLLGVYYKLYHEPDAQTTPYLMVGYSKLSIETDVASTLAEIEDKGFSYGLGVDYVISPTSKVHVEYMSYIDQDSFALEMLGVGYLSRY